MTGKITVGTIQDTAGDTVASTYVTNGVAKAWANVDTTATVNDSFNISSAADTSALYKTFTLTNNFSNANYVTSSQSASATGLYADTPVHGTTLTTSTYRTASYNVNTGGSVETDKNASMAIGDLA